MQIYFKTDDFCRSGYIYTNDLKIFLPHKSYFLKSYEVRYVYYQNALSRIFYCGLQLLFVKTAWMQLKMTKNELKVTWVRKS